MMMRPEISRGKLSVTVITYDCVRTCEGISRRLVKQGMKLILWVVKRIFLNFRSRIMRVAERKPDG